VERIFSSGTDLVVQRRCRLNNETIQQFMCLKGWWKSGLGEQENYVNEAAEISISWPVHSWFAYSQYSYDCIYIVNKVLFMSERINFLLIGSSWLEPSQAWLLWIEPSSSQRLARLGSARYCGLGSSLLWLGSSRLVRNTSCTVSTMTHEILGGSWNSVVVPTCMP